MFNEANAPAVGRLSGGVLDPGRARHGWKRIGNPVPPPFMRAIAHHIRREILPGIRQLADPLRG
jgi:hypothetical protein